MRTSITMGLTSLALLCMVQFANAGDASATPAQTPHWYDNVTGTKFTSLEGSTAQLSLGDDGLVLDVSTPDGSTADKIFEYMSDKLGAVYDAADKSTPIGVFRQSDTGIEAEYADGHSELISTNDGGGLTIAIKVPDAGLMCVKWYPQGHTFSEAERKEALAAYANKLGLSADAKLKPAATVNCADAPELPAKTALKTPVKAQRSSVKLTLHAPKTILVRASDVHTIDTDSMPQTAAAAAVIPVADAHVVKASDETAAPINHGASDCLSIDSDGQNWGFRNTCDNSVQFAYCLENGKDRETACGSGTAVGGVARHGFFALISSGAVIDDNHQFRWVACAGDAGTVTPHLDRSSPPAGRCVRAQNS